MREILFKGKGKNTGEWHKGLLARLQEDYCVVREERNQIIKDYFCVPSTICQYTGLTDKNGQKIWENDIVRFKHEKFDFDDGLESFERTCLPNKKEYKRNYVVEFCNTPTHYGLRFRNGSIWFMVHKMTIVMHDAEVIGNIFDNPELLERE